jgi:hypothetical protein
MKTLIKTLAKEFGLNQQQMADFFGIDRSIISRIQSGERPLPAKAIRQGTLMLQAMQQMQRSTKRSKPVQEPDLPQQMQLMEELILACRLQMRQLEALITRLKRQQQQCDKSITLLKHIAEKTTHSPHSRLGRWLAETQYQHEQQSNKCDAAQQWIMDVKLQGLAAQLACYQQQLTVIKNQINKP